MADRNRIRSLAVTARRMAAREVMTVSQAVFPELRLPLINPIVFSNASTVGDVVFNEWLHTGNVARVASQESVLLGRYPSGSLVDTLQSYLLICNGALVDEQRAPWINDIDQALRASAEAADLVDIDGPVLLAARYGETTWGHWLTDILPKIVIAESTFPGLFAFAVPSGIVADTAKRSYATAVLESLAAYGIRRERLLPIGRSRIYRFEKLFDVVGFKKDGIHPGVFSAMRNAVKQDEQSTEEKVAILRNRHERRSIYNFDEVREILHELGFTVYDFSKISFDRQIALVRGARVIVADLGSNLASVIYASFGIRLVTLGPANWFDGFFTNFAQRIGAILADVRGVSTTILPPGIDTDRGPANAKYVVPPVDLRAAVAHVTNFADSGGGIAIRSDRKVFPRRTGNMLFELSFGANGNGARCLETGWSTPENDHCWSVGPQSTIVIPHQLFFPTSCWMQIIGIGFTSGEVLRYRELSISVNGMDSAPLTVRDSIDTYVLIEANDGPGGRDTRIVLSHPFCPTPASMHNGNDTRNLGVGLISIVFWALC